MQMQEEPAFITIPLQTFKDILNEVQSAKKDQIKALKARQNEDIGRLAQDIALVYRQRLTKPEKVKPQSLQYDPAVDAILYFVRIH